MHPSAPNGAIRRPVSAAAALTFMFTLTACGGGSDASDTPPTSGPPPGAGAPQGSVVCKDYDMQDVTIAPKTITIRNNADEQIYPMLSTSTNAENLWVQGCLRTTEALRMLDPNFKPDEYSDYVLANLSQVTGDAVTALKAEFAQGVKNADLISVNLGSNDTMTFALIYMSSFLENLSAAQKNSVVMQRISLAEQQIKSLGTMGEALFNLLGAAKTLGQTGPALAALSAGMLKGYESFKQNWNILITDIKAANPDAVILAVGMYNPFRDVKFTDASLLSVGRLADQFVGLMNVYMKTLSPCASSYTFVSAADAQVYTFPALTSPDFTKNFVKYVHPDKTGHAYMAQQLLAAVPAGSGAGSAPLFDLQLSGRLMSKLAAAIAAVK